MLDFHEQKLTLGDFLETQKQNVLEEAEEPEPEPQERTRTVVKLAEGLDFIAVLIKVSEDIDSNRQRAAESRLRIIRMLAGYEEEEEEEEKKKKNKKKKKFLSRQTSVLDFSKSLSDTRTSPSALLYNEDDNPYDTTTVQEDASLFWTVIGLPVFVLSLHF